MGVLKLTPSGGTPVNYVLVPFRDGSHVRRPRNQDFATPFRQGPQSPQALDAYQSLIFPNFTRGVGRDRIASDSAFKVDEYRRFYDATADTRWESGTYGPIQEEDSTHVAGELNVIRASTSFKNNLWVTGEGDSSQDINVRKYTGSTDTFEGGAAISNRSGATVFAIALDLISHKTHMIALYGDSNDQVIERSVDGITWAAATTPITINLLTNVLDANENIDAGLLADIGGEAVAIIWHESNGTVTFFSSTDAGDNWTDEAVDIASGNGPQGVAVMAGIDNEDKLYVGTREGLWEVDTAPGTWTFRMIFPMVPDNDNCRRMKIHSDGALWFAQGVDNTSTPVVYRMFVSNGQRTIERVPNDFSIGDGLPAPRSGPIHWMESANGMMWVSSGGNAAGDKAGLWCHNGKGWHSMRLHGTANQKIEWIAASADDDGTPRLHYAVRTGSGSITPHFLGQPFVDPASGVSIKREDTGYIDLPFVDFGHPHESKNVLRVGINAKDLVDTNNEYINVDYGSASALGSPTARGSFTDLGNFLPAVGRITLGTNAGLNARTFALRVNIITDTAGNTTAAVLFDVSIDGYVVLPPTDTFEFQVDLKATDELLGKGSGGTITALNTARAETLLLALTYADIGTIYVRIPPTPAGLVYSEEIVDTGVGGASTTADANQRRQGVALVRVVQPIA